MAGLIGENTYKGLAVPLYGESQIQQLTTNTIVSMQLSSNNAGRFMLGTDQRLTTGFGFSTEYVIPQYSSLLTNLAVFDIDADGGYRAVSGTTVLIELNSSGIFGRDTLANEWRIDSSGRAQGVFRTVTTVTTGANFTIPSTASGTYYYVSGVSAGTAMFLILPGDAALGTYYDFWFTSQTALGDVGITSTAGGAVISMPGLNTSLVSTDQAISPASLQSQGLRLTLVATDLWFGIAGSYEHSSADTTDWTSADLERGSWQPLTTIS